MATRFITKYLPDGTSYVVPAEEGDEGEEDVYGLFGPEPPRTRIIVGPDTPGPVAPPQAPPVTSEDVPLGRENVPLPPRRPEPPPVPVELPQINVDAQAEEPPPPPEPLPEPKPLLPAGPSGAPPFAPPPEFNIPRGYEMPDTMPGPGPDYAEVERMRMVPGPHNQAEPFGPPRRPPTWEDVIEQYTRPTRQVVKGAVGTGLSLPWHAAGLMSQAAPAAISAAMPAMRPLMQQQPVKDVYGALGDYLHGRGAEASRTTADILGVEEHPTNFPERVGSIAGSSIVPYGKQTLAATGIATTGQVMGQGIANMVSPAEAARKKPAPIDPSGPQLDQTAAPTPPPSPNHVKVDSIGGPTWWDQSELKSVTLLAAMTVGMLYGKKVYTRFKKGDVPRFRDVQDAAPGTVALSKPRDLFHAYHDVNAPAIAVLRRLGIDPVQAQKVIDVLRIQTRATANAMVEGAINMGEMITPAFNFKTRISLADLATRETPQATRYINLKRTIEDIDSLGRMSAKELAEYYRKVGIPAHSGPPIVRGMDKLTAEREALAIERRFPEVKQFDKDYRHILQEVRKYEAAGEYATVTPSEHRNLTAAHKYNLGRKFTEDPLEKKGPITEQLGDYMQRFMRERMENEAVGMYVDAVKGASVWTQNKNAFKDLWKGALSEHEQWRRNTVTFTRRGKSEGYTTDPILADTLRMDPWSLMGGAGNAVYSMKRMFETMTTGELAPWFAFTSMYRNHQLATQSAKPGRKAPWFFQTAAAVPRQLAPPVAKVYAESLESGLAKAIHDSLDRASGGWLTKIGIDSVALSKTLANQYNKSLYYQLNTAGGGRGAIMQQQIDTNAMGQVNQAVHAAKGKGRILLEAYRATLNAMHNAPSFAYARRNINKAPLPQLAAEARGLTGDPRIGGQYYTKDPLHAGGRMPIRYVDETSGFAQGRADAYKQIGKLTEFGRTAVPWYNATVQGTKRVGEAYADDPARFTLRAWLYQIAPTATMYLLAKEMGKDPYGIPYVDHMTQRRSEYAKAMNIWFPVPGRPAADGIEIPSYHEGAILRSMTLIAMDHFMKTSFFNEGEDILRATKAVGGILADPTIPFLNLGAASGGVALSGGLFTGESFRPRAEPFDQLGGLPKTIEMYTRAIGAGLADILGQSYAAMSQPQQEFFERLMNGVKAGTRRTIEKSPGLSDITGIKAPMSGNTAISDEMHKRKRVIDDLQRYYKDWTKNQGMIGIKPRSQEGGEVASAMLGPHPPPGAAGINQPTAKNPIYDALIEDLHNTFIKDAPYAKVKGGGVKETGAIGFQSIYQRYSIATTQLQRLRKVNEGNYNTWQKQLHQERPEVVEYLKKNGLSDADTRDIRRVRNFFENQRHVAARTILHQIREVEARWSKMLGKPIKLEDVMPYAQESWLERLFGGEGPMLAPVDEGELVPPV